MGYIYRISNLINHKTYIGLSIDYKARWKQHIRALNKNRHCNWKLQKDWNLFGAEAFEFQIVEERPYEQCFNEEIKYIALFNSYTTGYNLTQGGDKGGSESTCKPVYVYDLKGNYICSFYSKAEAERELNCHSIKECCLGSCRRGFSKTNQEWYQYSYFKYDKMSPYQKSVSPAARPVYQLNCIGQILQTFKSVADANRFCGMRPNGHNIRDAILSHRQYHNSYWCYVEDYTEDWEPANECSIAAFNSAGDLVGYYKNATDAGNKLGIDHSSISKVLRGEKLHAKNLIFRKI